MQKLTCFFDGACYPKNPGGEMGYGAMIKNENKIAFSCSGVKEASETNTNNVAEYLALAAILNHLYDSGIEDAEINIFGDSMLVISQMQGKWRIKSGAYAETALQCRENIDFLKNERNLSFTFKWIPREQNTECDALSKVNEKPQFKRIDL